MELPDECLFLTGSSSLSSNISNMGGGDGWPGLESSLLFSLASCSARYARISFVPGVRDLFLCSRGRAGEGDLDLSCSRPGLELGLVFSLSGRELVLSMTFS